MQLEEKLTSTQAPSLLSQWQQKPRCSHLADDPQTSWEFSVKKGRQLSRAYYTPLKTPIPISEPSFGLLNIEVLQCEYVYVM